MSHVSRALVLVLMVGGFFGAFAIFAIGGVIAGLTESEEVLAAAMLVGVLLLLIGFITWLWVLYRAWAAIQDGAARTTPGRAVGFCFIPIFNILWIFQAAHAWAQDYNQFRKRHQIQAPEAKEGLFMAYCGCTAAGTVPYVGLIAEVASAILSVVCANTMCNGINAIADAQMGIGIGYVPPSWPT